MDTGCGTFLAWMVGSLWWPIYSRKEIADDADHTITLRMVLSPSLVKEPRQFISLWSIHVGKILQRVFFNGLLGLYLVCREKGHVAAECTRPSRQWSRRQVQAHWVRDRVRKVRRRETRRREAKKSRRQADAASPCLTPHPFQLSHRLPLAPSQNNSQRSSVRVVVALRTTRGG